MPQELRASGDQRIGAVHGRGPVDLVPRGAGPAPEATPGHGRDALADQPDGLGREPELGAREPCVGERVDHLRVDRHVLAAAEHAHRADPAGRVSLMSRPVAGRGQARRVRRNGEQGLDQPASAFVLPCRPDVALECRHRVQQQEVRVADGLRPTRAEQVQAEVLPPHRIELRLQAVGDAPVAGIVERRRRSGKRQHRDRRRGRHARSSPGEPHDAYPLLFRWTGSTLTALPMRSASSPRPKSFRPSTPTPSRCGARSPGCSRSSRSSAGPSDAR